MVRSTTSGRRTAHERRTKISNSALRTRTLCRASIAVVVKVIDILGNDTTKTLTVEVM